MNISENSLGDLFYEMHCDLSSENFYKIQNLYRGIYQKLLQDSDLRRK